MQSLPGGLPVAHPASGHRADPTRFDARIAGTKVSDEAGKAGRETYPCLPAVFVSLGHLADAEACGVITNGQQVLHCLRVPLPAAGRMKARLGQLHADLAQLSPLLFEESRHAPRRGPVVEHR